MQLYRFGSGFANNFGNCTDKTSYLYFNVCLSKFVKAFWDTIEFEKVKFFSDLNCFLLHILKNFHKFHHWQIISKILRFRFGTFYRLLHQAPNSQPKNKLKLPYFYFVGVIYPNFSSYRIFIGFNSYTSNTAEDVRLKSERKRGIRSLTVFLST